MAQPWDRIDADVKRSLASDGEPLTVAHSQGTDETYGMVVERDELIEGFDSTSQRHRTSVQLAYSDAKHLVRGSTITRTSVTPNEVLTVEAVLDANKATTRVQVRKG